LFGASNLKNSNLSRYEACMDVIESDHKPVRCKLNVEISHADRLVKRQEYGKIIEKDERINSFLQDSCNAPETIVSTNNVILQTKGTTILRITNKGFERIVVYSIICEGVGLVKCEGDVSEISSRGSFGFPNWLEVQN
jgi:hypothetical protein